MTSGRQARKDRKENPPMTQPQPNWDDVLRTLDEAAQNQGAPGLALPPIPGNLPVVDPANPFMQQVTEMPTLMQTAVVEAPSAFGIQERRMIVTFRNHSTTFTCLVPKAQALQWAEALTNTAAQMSDIVTATRVD